MSHLSGLLVNTPVGIYSRLVAARNRPQILKVKKISKDSPELSAVESGVKNSGVGAGRYRQGDRDGRRWACVWFHGCTGELDNNIISSSLGRVGGQNECIG
jgi:hypothetical protein